MALFGLFGSKDPAETIKRLQAKATKKFGPTENRSKALDELREMGTAEAYTAMLQRFTVNVEPSITDQTEKDFVFSSLVDAGQAAVAPVKAFIRTSAFPTWPLRVLEKLVPAQEVVETILDTLDREGPDYTRDPEKKLTLVRHLQSFQDSRIASRLVPFLADVSEDVSVAAIGVVAEQPSEEVHEPLVQALLRADEISSERLRLAAAEALRKCEISVKGHTPAVTAALPPGFSLDKQGHVHARK